MLFSIAARTAPLALLASMLLTLAACGQSVPPYEFTTATHEVARGATIVEVLLKNNATGTTVTDAVITATRLDMSPDGMQAMASTVEPQGASEAGVYRFNAKFTMAGRWALSLRASVPGEPKPINGTVIFTVN